MDILTPDKIKSTLFDRLQKTQKVFDSINVSKEDNLDIVQSVYAIFLCSSQNTFIAIC